MYSFLKIDLKSIQEEIEEEEEEQEEEERYTGQGNFWNPLWITSICFRFLSTLHVLVEFMYLSDEPSRPV